MKNSLKLALCSIGFIVSAPALAHAPGNSVTAKHKAPHAVDDVIGRMQLDALIATIVDGDKPARRPAAAPGYTRLAAASPTASRTARRTVG